MTKYINPPVPRKKTLLTRKQNRDIAWLVILACVLAFVIISVNYYLPTN